MEDKEGTRTDIMVFTNVKPQFFLVFNLFLVFKIPRSSVIDRD